MYPTDRDLKDSEIKATLRMTFVTTKDVMSLYLVATM